MQKVEFNNGSYIEQGNCFDLLDSLEAGSVDALITDPPYTNGKGKDALKGHKIQTVIDIPLFMQKANRVLKPNSFLAFTMQTPYDLAWRIEAEKYFDFRIDIVWAKKKGSMGGNLQMKRSHENIYIFSKGQINYFKTIGEYSDVSQALVEYNLKDIESIFRQLSYWKGIAQGKYLKSIIDKGAIKDNYFIKKGLGNKQSASLGNEKSNFNSVWAFSTHNLKYRNEAEGNIKHPSVKPIDLFIRLIELLTPDPTPEYTPLIVDPFIGSGTTCIAGAKTKRRFIGFELLDEGFWETNEQGEQVWTDGYFTISQKRILKAFKELAEQEAQTAIFQ